MSGLYVLDSCAVMVLLKGKSVGRYIDRTYRLRERRTPAAISVVTHGELLVLALRNGWGLDRRRALDSALRDLVTLDINHEAVIAAYADIELYSQSLPKGARNMGKNDLWIAACAKASGATLITLDKDFNHLADELLKVEYVDPAGKYEDAPDR